MIPVRVLVLTLTLAGGMAPAHGADKPACRWLPRHQPAPDVAYTPGRDVHGRAVAPADAPGSAGVGAVGSGTITPRVEFALTPTELSTFLNRLPETTRAALGPAHAGRIRIEGEKVYYNGQLLSDRESEALVAGCGEAQKR